MKNKAFTLIEVIVVLVILAIVSLIAVPIVLNIIDKSKLVTDKRSIDAYGHAIELAIAKYELDMGHLPQNITDISIEYTGNEVVCDEQIIKKDSTVYLSKCKVAGEPVDYTYGTRNIQTIGNYETYNIGDIIRYKNTDFYVIKNSDSHDDTLTLLKKNAFTTSEMTNYVEQSEKNIEVLNANENFYGTIAYGSSADYATSNAKAVVDAWAENNLDSSDVIETRLITIEELSDNLGFEIPVWTSFYVSSNDTPDWIFGEGTNITFSMSQHNDNADFVWGINGSHGIDRTSVSSGGIIRPVIVLSKDTYFKKI